MIIDIPTEPEYCKTPFGETNIPDPTIIPIMIEAPSISPNCRFNFVSELCDVVSGLPIFRLDFVQSTKIERNMYLSWSLLLTTAVHWFDLNREN